MSHIGTRVSALVDGRLAPAEEERCWEHVLLCPPCRDLVEREGWVKTRLAGLSYAPTATAPPSLKDSLRSAPTSCPRHGPDSTVAARTWSRGLVAFGGSALGAAVLGAVALGPGLAQSSSRPPQASLGGQVSTPTPGPAAGARRPDTTERETWPFLAAMGAGPVLASFGVTDLVEVVVALGRLSPGDVLAPRREAAPAEGAGVLPEARSGTGRPAQGTMHK
jgi:hypothetical protein